MRRAVVMAALLWAAAAGGAWGRELPVQRDLVQPMDFGGGETREDLRAAPDVAMAIERREEFAREQKGGRKGLLVRGERRASGVGMYYGESSGEGEGKQKSKKDDWLVKSVTQGAFGNTNGSQSVVQSVLSKDSEEEGESKWGWLAQEMEQRKNEEAAGGAAEGEEEATGVEGLYAETPEEAMLIQQATAPREEETKKPDSMAEQDAKREEIRKGPAQEAPAAFAGMQKNLDDIREKLALNAEGTAGKETKPDAVASDGARDWSQPLLGREPMQVTRIPEPSGMDFRGTEQGGAAGIGMGYERPSGDSFGYERPTSAGFGYERPSGGGGFGLPSSGTAVGRADAPSWGMGSGTAHGGSWGGSSRGGSGWSALPISGAGGASGWNTGGGDRGSYTTTRPDPTRIGTPGGGTLMPW